MQPTHENIDRWLFDYTEGNLSADQEQQLESFLMDHPELELDMDAWEMAKVDVTPIIFNNKTALYRKRSYKPALALFSVLLLVVSGLMFFQNAKNESAQASVTKGTNKKELLKDNRTAANTKRTLIESQYNQKTNDDQSSSPVEGLYNSTPVSSPIETTRNKTGQISSISIGQQRKNQQRDAKESSSIAETKIQTTGVYSTLNDLTFEKMEFMKIHPLKTMFIGRHRTNVKNVELMEGHEAISSDLSLDNLNIIRKIDQLLSKDIGLSNNQNYDYTVSGQSNLDLNFSSVGTTSQTRFQLISSLRSLEDPSQLKLSNQLSLDGYSRNIRSGFGVQANYDLFGDGMIKTSQVAVIFSPKIALSRKISIEPAVRFKMGTHELDATKVMNSASVEQNIGQVNQFNFDPNLAIGKTLWYRDLDAGLTINTPILFLSTQISNIFEHNENIYSNDGGTMRASRALNLIAGTQYASRNEKMIFSPYALYQQTKFQQQIFGGFTFKAGKAQLGMSYGHLATGSLSLGFVGENFTLIGQSSYGTLASTLNKTFTHQLTLRIHSSVSKKARRYISL
jgi:hypothetical protein